LAKVPGLRKPKDTYFYIRRVPADLASFFNNRTQICESLQTTVRSLAEPRARQMAVRYDEMFIKARLGVPVETKSGKTVSSRTLVQVAKRHLHRLLTSEKGLLSPDDAHYFLEEAMHLEAELRDGTFPTEKISKIIDENSLSIALASREWFELAELVSRAEIEAALRKHSLAKKSFSATAQDPLFRDVAADLPRPTLESPKGLPLDELIFRFENDPARTAFTEASRQKYLIPFAALKEVFGPQCAIREITREQCAGVRDLIAVLPSNHKKYPKFRGLKLNDMVALAKKDNSRILSFASTSGYVRRISTLFSYAVDSGLMDTDPASGLIKKAKSPKKRKLVFQSDELSRLIENLPSWAGEHRGGSYWLPLIAMFSGMRLGEIIWLKKGDVRNIDGVLCFVLEETEDRSLKTANATRIIPVHSKLTELGLGDYTETIKNNADRLFF
jgi:hypothetical protein